MRTAIVKVFSTQNICGGREFVEVTSVVLIVLYSNSLGPYRSRFWAHSRRNANKDKHGVYVYLVIRQTL